MVLLRAVCLFILFVFCLFLAACVQTPAAEPTAAVLTSASTSKTLASSSTRTPFPPPTRRVSIQTGLPARVTAAIPSLTPLPPLHLYIFPIQPPGAASFGPGVKGHGYPATDLFAPLGTTFVAVTNGIIDFVSLKDEWMPNSPDPAKRSGLAVAIIGDDGVRYYGSHLSNVLPEIVPGLRVKAGQTLGYVGASGDARGKDPHLHFGISHPTTPDDWKARRGEVDPYSYLLAWNKGLNFTPKLP
ncbi:MAG: M23 family metallopeptidase [Chloroflexi bacterium]|nr:M23 family metallopeptidase [Chloroflexota bacterium]